MRLPFLGHDRISPTAFYTGQVWLRNGLSHPAFGTVEGRLMYEAVRPTMLLSGTLGGPTLEDMLLARHRVIDALVEAAIDDGRVGAVVELACGMSPRGWRFSERHGSGVAYVEADLPGMAARKRERLALIGSPGERHRVVDLDVTEDGALERLFAELDAGQGVAVVTEGLLNYLPEAAVRSLWERIAGALQGFPAGLYVSDLAVGGTRDGALATGFTTALSVFVRGGVHQHFAGEAGAEAALREAGFAEATVHDPSQHAAAADRRGKPGAAMMRVLEASI